MPGEGLTHGPPATKKAGGSHHRISRTSGIPCAIVYSLYVISPGTGSLAPVARVMRSIIRELGISTGMPEPHDFAVRLQHDRRRAFRVHRSPLLRFVTIGRNAPSSPRDGRKHRSDLPDGTSAHTCDKLARRAICA
jgi:hypothetical protein